MPLTQEQEERDYELRIEQMQTNIEKLRADMKWENRKFAVQVIVGAAVCVGAGVALANYVNSRPPAPSPPAPPPQIIYIQPGPPPSTARP